MKKLTLICAALGLLLCACDKPGHSVGWGRVFAEDLVGEWVNTNPNEAFTLTFYDDGKFKQDYGYDVEFTGTWGMRGADVIGTFLGNDASTSRDSQVRLLGGKNALVIRFGDPNEMTDQLFYRKGATTIKSGKLKDGRYDAFHNGIRNVGNNEKTFTFLIKGKEMELYVFAWGIHLKGTYSIENGYLKYNVTQGWYAVDTVKGGWDYGEAYINFEDYTFENKDYAWAEGIKYAEDFTDIPFCVSDDGLDVYVSAAGLTRWAFLRDE